jgi:pimeloyl-ACP methyl ester carboxylesterase
MHLVGDVVGLIAALEEENAIVVGHDWGAPVAWATALMRPDLVRGVACLSVPPGGPLVPVHGEATPPISAFREKFGDAFYMVQFQEPGVAERQLGTDLHATFLGILAGAAAGSSRQAPRLDDEQRPAPSSLPEWLTEADIEVFVNEYSERGFAGGLNWYRNIDRNWELLAPWAGAVITPPSLLMIGDRDITRGFLPIPDSLEALRKLAPGARALMTLEDCGHWTQQERPDTVSDALVEFARSVA